MSDRIPALLEPIQERLDAATPGPWDRFDAQIRHTQIDGWVDPEGRKAAQEQTERDIQFVINAPTDQARLLAAVQAVTALHPREVIAIHPGYGEEAMCPECGLHYPCPTISAVVAVLGGEA